MLTGRTLTMREGHVNGLELGAGEALVLAQDINGNTWQGGLALEQSLGKQLTYKYAIFREDAQGGIPRRENRTTRRRVVPEAGSAKWRDIWEE